MDNIAFRFKAAATANHTDQVDAAQEDQLAAAARNIKRSKVDNSQPAIATQQPPPEEPSIPPFLRLPAELRNKIYAYATSHSETLVVTTPNQVTPPRAQAPSANPRDVTAIWQLPPLAQVNKQFLHEVTPIFFECNTLSLHSMDRMRLWYPFRSINHMENIAAIFFDLASSCKYSFTLKKFGIQPTMLIKEDVRKVRVGRKVAGGEKELLEVEDFRLVVKWEPFERAIASSADNPRPSLFLSQTQLEEAWVEEGRRGKRLMDGTMLAQKMASEEATKLSREKGM